MDSIPHIPLNSQTMRTVIKIFQVIKKLDSGGFSFVISFRRIFGEPALIMFVRDTFVSSKIYFRFTASTRMNLPSFTPAK